MQANNSVKLGQRHLKIINEVLQNKILPTAVFKGSLINIHYMLNTVLEKNLLH